MHVNNTVVLSKKIPHRRDTHPSDCVLFSVNMCCCFSLLYVGTALQLLPEFALVSSFIDGQQPTGFRELEMLQWLGACLVALHSIFALHHCVCSFKAHFTGSRHLVAVKHCNNIEEVLQSIL